MPALPIGIKHSIAWTALVVSVLIGALTIPTAAAGQRAAALNTADLQAFHLVSASEGWALVNQQLYWTGTDGQAWQNITPPAPPNGGVPTIRAVMFLNSRAGWLVSTQTDPHNVSPVVHYVLSRTADGGQSWQTGEIALIPVLTAATADMAAVYLDVLDTKTGWVVIKNATSINFSTGMLFKTSDGGRTWTQLSIPIGAPVYFVTGSLGWTAGGAAGDKLFRTQDGGRTWVPRSIPVSSPGAQAYSYQTPTFDDAQSGVLPVVATQNGQSQVQFYVTHDGGDSWTLQVSVPMRHAVAPETPIPLTIFNTNSFTLVVPGGQQSAQILNMANGSQTAVASQDNFTAGIVELDMANASTGWARYTSGSCTLTPAPAGNGNPVPPGGVNKACATQTALLRTGDGGQTWQMVVLPGSVSAAPDTNAPSFYPGFDACEVPSLSQMQDWWANSPYYSINLYIGGSERGCANGALSATYTAQLTRQGWLFFPTWVGPQGSGNSCGCTILISNDPATAYNQGVNEANAAANTAAGLGLGGSVIYYDLETFDYSNSTYLNAAQHFISGWSGQLRSRGYQAGVYGSPCSSALSAYANISNAPNVIWPAGGGFYAPSYDSSATVWGLNCLSNSLWANHERIYQYSAGHAETWGSTTYPIDSDALDGLVANNTSAAIDSIGIFRPSTNAFYLRLHNSTGVADYTITFNPASKPYPVVGDWTGSGYDTVGILDQANGLFTLCIVNTTTSCANPANWRQLVLGNANDQPLAGRWSGAASAGVGVFRPSNGLIYLKKVLSTGYADDTMVLGIPGDIGLSGDWNSDGVDSPGVYRPSNITFYLNDQVCNCAVTARYTLQYGVTGDVPVIGNWVAQGHDGVGLFRQSNGYTYLRNTLTTGYADIAFVYGIAGDIPVAGHWQLTYPPVALPGGQGQVPPVPVVPTAASGPGPTTGLGD